MFGSCLLPTGKDHRRALWAIVAVGILFVGPIIGSTTVFGIDAVRTMAYPTFEELKRIEVAEFVANLDVLGVFLWTLGSFIKAAVFLWAAATGVASLANVSDYRRLVTPLSVIAVGLAFATGTSRPMIHRFLNKTYPVYGIAVGILLPLLLALWAWVRRPRDASGIPGHLGSGASHQGNHQ